MDLDNTLLDDNKKISRESTRIINKLIDNGYEVVIATGRRYYSAKRLIKDINRPLTIIANNGGIARDSTGATTLFERTIDLEGFKNIVEKGRARNLHPIVHVNSYKLGYDIIIEMDIENEAYGRYFHSEEDRYRKVDDFLALEDERILAIVYLGSKLELEEFYKEINRNYNQTYNYHIVENIQAAESLLEIMNPLACKWQGLQKYAKLKGIRDEEIITIGDDNNDLTMIKNAGLGIAMKNSTSKVKAVADIITERDNNESGLAYELERILF